MSTFRSATGRTGSDLSDLCEPNELDPSSLVWIGSICEQLGDGYLVFAQWQCVGLGGPLWRDAGSPRLYRVPEDDWLSVFQEEDRGPVALALADPSVNRFPAVRVLDRRTQTHQEVRLRLFKPPFATQPGLFVLVAQLIEAENEAVGDSRASEMPDGRVFDGCPAEMLVVDTATSSVAAANRSFYQRNRLKADGVVGKSLGNLRILEAEVADLVMGTLQFGGQLRRRPIVLTLADGTVREMLIDSSALGGDRALLVLTDVTLHNSATRHLNLILNQLPVGVYTKDRGGTYLLSNQAADRFLNRGEPLRGLHDEELFPPARVEEIAGTERRVFETGQTIQSEEIVPSQPEDESRVFEVIRMPVHNDDGRVHRLLGIVRELSGGLPQEELASAQASVDQVCRAKDEFLENTGHEVRTPMNAIMGFTALLAETNLDPEQRELLQTVRTSGERLSGVIDAILELSHLSSGTLRFAEQEFDLEFLLEEAIAEVAPAAVAEKIGLHLEVDLRLPTRCLGDPVRLRQVVHQLVDNAVKFTDNGEVECSADLVGRADNAFDLRIRVRDTGIGIPGELHEAIFGAFFQVDGSATRHHEGTGLGLTLSRRLAQAMGGNVTLESTPGAGSTFTATFHLKTTAEGEIREQVSWPDQAELVVLAENVSQAARMVRPFRSCGVKIQVARTFPQFASIVCSHAFGGVGLVEVAALEETELARLAEVRTRGHPLSLILTTPSESPPEAIGRMAPWAKWVSSRPLRPSHLRTLVHTLMTQPPAVPEAVEVTLETVRNREMVVLMIEDRSPQRDLIVRTMRDEGVTVDVCESEASAMLHVTERDYDAVFFEANFVGDGTQAMIAGIRAAQKADSPHFVALALSKTAEEARMRALEVRYVLEKPVSPEALRETLAALRDEIA